MPAGPRGPLTKPFEQQSREELWAGVIGPLIWLLMPMLIVAMTFSPGMTASSLLGLWLVRGAISVVCGGVAFAMAFPRLRELRKRSKAGRTP
jgi:low temperature requirement protein LtrA